MVCVFFIFQQITGINVPLYYGPHLLGPIFSGAHASLVQTTVAGVEVTAIMTAVNVASTYLGFRWIDKFGRKPLAIGGYTGMIVFALVSALGLAFMHGTPRLIVIMIGLDFFIASFAVGVGGTGWTLQGEVFPTAVRGQAAAFAAMIDWLANFALIEVFLVTQNAIGLAGVMVIFASLCALAIVFVWKAAWYHRDGCPSGAFTWRTRLRACPACGGAAIAGECWGTRRAPSSNTQHAPPSDTQPARKRIST